MVFGSVVRRFFCVPRRLTVKINFCGSAAGFMLGDAKAAVATATTRTGPPIPEYPLGLPIHAILMIIGYGIVRRKTRSVINRLVTLTRTLEINHGGNVIVTSVFC